MTPATAQSVGQVRVAVAANFIQPMDELARLFEKTSQHKILASSGATGAFYAQITQGAPYDVFLSADETTPAKLLFDGHAVSGTAVTYAIGRLVLFSRTPGLVVGPDTLQQNRFAKLTIANPATAPYGAAAIDVLKNLMVLENVRPKLVQGASIAQAYQFVDTGNAALGLIALAQVAKVDGGSRWVVPRSLHAPIKQNAVLLKLGATNPAAQAFLAFLMSAEAQKVITAFGYDIE